MLNHRTDSFALPARVAALLRSRGEFEGWCSKASPSAIAAASALAAVKSPAAARQATTMVTRVGAQTAIYCLSDGASLPAWAEQSDQARRKALKRDEKLGRRVELLQGLEFEGGASRRIKFSDDGRMLVCTGEYLPACKVFELSQLGQKYERRLGCAAVDVWPLSPDLGKMVFFCLIALWTSTRPMVLITRSGCPRLAGDCCTMAPNVRYMLRPANVV